MEDFAERIRERAMLNFHPHVPVNFDADTPAILYTLTPASTGRLNFLAEVRLGYDPERTMIFVSKEDINFTIDRDAAIGYEVYYVRGSGLVLHPLQVLVIGDDTLSWSIIERMSDPINVKEDFFDVTQCTETPREFIARAQESLAAPFPVKPDDFLMRNVDFNIDPERSEIAHNIARSFMNIASRWPRNLSGWADAVAIPFEPGEERMLRISFSSDAAIEWDEELQQSLFHHTILTELAAYWEFFDELTVTVTHPDDAINYAFSEGFNTVGGHSVLTLLHPPQENILFGFWMEDEREPERFRHHIVEWENWDLDSSLNSPDTPLAAALVFTGISGSVAVIIIALKKRAKRGVPT